MATLVPIVVPAADAHARDDFVLPRIALLSAVR